MAKRGIGLQPNGLDGFTNWKTDGTLQTGTLQGRPMANRDKGLQPERLAWTDTNPRSRTAWRAVLFVTVGAAHGDPAATRQPGGLYLGHGADG